MCECGILQMAFQFPCTYLIHILSPMCKFSEQQLRERIINMASRNKEKQRIADETICALRNENAKLLVRIVEMEKVLAPPC